MTRDMRGGLNMIPTGMGLLTQLHKLHLSTGNPDEDVFDIANLCWISEMTPLADLSMSFGKCAEDMMQGVILLTNLTSLAVTGLDDCEETFVNINIDWHKLQALQELSICNCSMQLGPGIGGLLKLDKLQQISFQRNRIEADREDCDISNVSCFGALTYHLARLRPQVELLLDSSDVLDYFP